MIHKDQVYSVKLVECYICDNFIIIALLPLLVLRMIVLGVV